MIWFHALPQGTGATDFRTQTYLGQPVLTWFQAASPSTTADYIYSDRYQQIAKVRAANGYETDFHEFLITPWNTALILADDMTTANLTSIGGPSDQAVVDGVVQEIDIKTGQVLFQWNSADHVPYTDSHLPRPSAAACTPGSTTSPPASPAAPHCWGTAGRSPCAWTWPPTWPP